MKKAVLLSVILLTISFSKDIVELGIEAYDQGNYYKAAEIFSTACDDGNAECCNMLGALYSDGLGVKVDYHKAAWLHKKLVMVEVLSLVVIWETNIGTE